MHLYYTGEENGNPMITFPYTKSAIEGTVCAFDDTVHKIMKKDFKTWMNNPKHCRTVTLDITAEINNGGGNNV